MYILSYERDYEGQMVLGVYATLDSAMVAVQRQGFSIHGDERPSLRDDLVIRRFAVDAEPEFDAGTIVWAAPESTEEEA